MEVERHRCRLEAHAIARGIPGQLAQLRNAIAPGPAPRLLVVVQPGRRRPSARAPADCSIRREAAVSTCAPARRPQRSSRCRRPRCLVGHGSGRARSCPRIGRSGGFVCRPSTVTSRRRVGRFSSTAPSVGALPVSAGPPASTEPGGAASAGHRTRRDTHRRDAPVEPTRSGTRPSIADVLSCARCGAATVRRSSAAFFPRALGKAAHRELKANGRRLVDRCLAEHVRVPAAAVVARPVEPRVVSAIAPVFIRGVRFGCFGGRGIMRRGR
jgi:hypothetical protein